MRHYITSIKNDSKRSGICRQKPQIAAAKRAVFQMTISLDQLRGAVASKLAQLLKDDGAGWSEAARWIDKRALEEGIDLFADFESPEHFSNSLVEGMRFHTDFEQRFPNGLADLGRFESAEELFWHLMPHRESDYSAGHE
jgi:hypothetical protein